MYDTRNGKVCVKFTLIVVILVLNVELNKAQWAVDDDGCRTPNKAVGNCIPIKNCRPILNVIEGIDMLTKDIIEMLRSYQCGFHQRGIKVCCPQEEIVLKKSQTGKPTKPKNNYTHKNLHLLPSECGISASECYITYGETATLFEFPWMALLFSYTENGINAVCAGTIINKNYILTAAHCISNIRNWTPMYVRLGEHDRNSIDDCEGAICAPPVQDISVDEVIPHPDYDRIALTDDIGLIRLGSPINTDVENVKPICLPTTNSLQYMDFTNDSFTVTGWGYTERNEPSPTLLKLNVPVVTREDCQKTYVRLNKTINARQICAGGDKSDSCKGDSGGPLQRIRNINNEVRFVQYGVVAYGSNNCGGDGIPAVYTRVDYYMDWILDNIKP